MKTLVALSGGQTSASLIEIFGTGPDVEYVFINVGFEHPKTYDFLRNLKQYYSDMRLTCLEPVVHHGERKANTYKVVPVETVGMKPEIMVEHVKKYGGFTVSVPNCSQRMKTNTMTAYKRDHYDCEHRHIIGFRADEQRRILGQQGYKLLKSLGYEEEDVCAFKEKWFAMYRAHGEHMVELDIRMRFIQTTKETEKQVKSLVSRIRYLVANSIEYMAEYSDMEKSDVNQQWEAMPFRLGLPEFLGNCVFCVKKNERKIALAARFHPELVPQWLDMLEQRRHMKGYDGDRQYRGTGYLQSLSDVIAKFDHLSTEELYEWVMKSPMPDVDGCSESCDAFGSQLDSL